MTRQSCLSHHSRQTICFALAALGYGRKTPDGRIEGDLDWLTDDNAEEVDEHIQTTMNMDGD